MSGNQIGTGAGDVARTFNHYDRETLTALKLRLDESKLPLLIFVNKGVEIKTRALTLEIIADTCGPEIAKVATFIVSTCYDAARLPSNEGFLVVGAFVRVRK